MSDYDETSTSWRPMGVFAASVLGAVVITGVSWVAMRALVVARTPVPPIYRLAEEHGVSPIVLTEGWTTYAGSCSICHGKSGEGKLALGKPLRNNPFVQSLTDDELALFIAEGRPPTAETNTTGIPMPPRGGNLKVTDGRIHAIVAYLRTIQDPDAEPTDMAAWVIDRSASISSGPGHQLFISACSACHGPDGSGMPGMGKSLRTSEFVSSKSDKELLTFIKTGRPIWDEANTTGVDMPPKGGNPALKEEELEIILQHIRSIHE